MRLFNRNNHDDEIGEILTNSRETSAIIQNIVKSNKDLEKELYSLKEQHKYILELNNEIINLKKEIKDVKKQLEENYGEMVELNQTTTDTNKVLVAQIDKFIGNKENSLEEENKPSRNNRDIYILKDYGVIINKRGETDFKVCDLLYIKQGIESKNPLCTPAYFQNKLGLASNTIQRLIAEIRRGDWEPLFEELFTKVEEHNKKIDVKFHFVDMANSYKQPYLNLKLEDGEIYTPKHLCSVPTLLRIKEDIPKMNAENLSHYSKKYGIKGHTFRRVVWNIEEGNFDEVLDEYFSLKYNFEFRNNFLYIDGEYTALTLEKCKIMVSGMCSLTNNHDNIVNSYIKLYSTINPKYIRIVCGSYSNPHLNKLLSPSKQQSYQNDPQKRREMFKSMGGGI